MRKKQSQHGDEDDSMLDNQSLARFGSIKDVNESALRRQETIKSSSTSKAKLGLLRGSSLRNRKVPEMLIKDRDGQQRSSQEVLTPLLLKQNESMDRDYMIEESIENEEDLTPHEPKLAQQKSSIKRMPTDRGLKSAEFGLET